MMELITTEKLLAVMPAAKGKAALCAPFLNSGMAEFGINTDARIRPFLANLAHETGDLQNFSENLSYSAVGLAKTWPRRYAVAPGVPSEAAKLLSKAGPQAIANNVYANRGGNGDEASGDGWLFRGAGGFQITFRDNHARVAKHFGIPVEKVGDWLRTPEGAMRSACWFFWQAGCAKLADKGDFDGVCDLINLGRQTDKYGDSIGFAARIDKLAIANRVIV